MAFFLVIGVLVASLNSVFDLWGRFSGGSEVPPRLAAGAFELGGDLPIANWGGDVGGETGPIPLPVYDSRVRTNLNLLRLQVAYPPGPKYEDVWARAQVMDEAIHPQLEARNDKIVYYFDYGWHWRWIQLGADFLVLSQSNTRPKIMWGFLREMQKQASDPRLEELEHLIGLSSEGREVSAAIREQIAGLDSPYRRDVIKAVHLAAIQFMNDVRAELCRRPDADCAN